MKDSAKFTTTKRLVFFVSSIAIVVCIPVFAYMDIIDISERARRIPVVVTNLCDIQNCTMRYRLATSADELDNIIQKRDTTAFSVKSGEEIFISIIAPTTLSGTIIGHKWIVFFVSCSLGNHEAYTIVIPVDQNLIESRTIRLPCPCES